MLPTTEKPTQAGPVSGLSVIALLDRIEIFLFGRRFGNKPGAKHGPYTLRVPECLWQMAPTGDYHAVTFTIHAAPCFLHRWAQTVLLGIRYRRTKV